MPFLRTAHSFHFYAFCNACVWMYLYSCRGLWWYMYHMIGVVCGCTFIFSLPYKGDYLEGGLWCYFLALWPHHWNTHCQWSIVFKNNGRENTALQNKTLQNPFLEGNNDKRLWLIIFFIDTCYISYNSSDFINYVSAIATHCACIL